MRRHRGEPLASFSRIAALRRASAAVAWIALALSPWHVVKATGAPARHHFHVAGGLLDDALHALAAQGEIQLLYAPTLTAHRHSNGLEGDLTSAQALALLLHESGLRADAVNDDTFVLRRAPPAARPLPPIPVSDGPKALAEVEVTGTHLRRTRVETAQPITIIGRRQIEHSGYQTLYELLRAQPGVRVNNAPVALSDGTIYQANGLSGATGAAAVDLHGLGATATLFLIDGQRMAGYGLAQGEYSLVNDLDSIPLAMVERIEVLRDGASAIYGSDAMAGVVNIFLRKRFDGVALDGNTGVSGHGDAAQRRATATAGTALAGGGNLLLSADYLRRDPLLGRQRNWARTAQAGLTTSGGNDSYYYFNGGQISQSGPPACTQTTLDGPCTFQAAAQTTLQTSLDSRSLLAHADYPLGSLEIYADLRWNMLRQQQQTAPDTEQLQVTTPGQPGSDRVVNYAFADIGPVLDTTKSRSEQVTLGLRGNPGDWSWDLRLDDQHNVGTDRVHGLLRSSVLDRALADGSYQPGSTSNAPALLAALSPTLLRTGSTRQTGFSARANGPLADLPHGPLELAFGAEGYRERMDDQPDPLLISNDVFQFQSPYVRRGDRWISAAYLEAEAPLSPRLTANLAARLDHSGGFGWAFSPRLALKFDASDTVSFRATVARGYRAPTLPELDRSQALLPAGVRVEVPDNLLPCRDRAPQSSRTSVCTLRLDSVANPNLQPERSRSLTLGMVLAPTPALGIALDIYQIDRRHEIRPLPVPYALEHPDSYPQLFRRGANGELVAFQQQLVNLGHTMVRTFDLDAHYRLETRRAGQFTFNLGLDWLSKLRREIHPGAGEEPYAGYAGEPKATALAGLEWSLHDWVGTANVRYTGHYAYAPSANSLLTCPTEQRKLRHCNTPAFALLDLDLEYGGFDHWRIGLNVHNVLDHRPTFYGSPPIGYSTAFDDVVGRYFLLSFHYRR